MWDMIKRKKDNQLYHLPFNINQPSSIDIESVTFDLNRVRFTGDGTLEWNIKDGFHLNSKVQPTKKLESFTKSFGGAKIIPKKLFRFKINKVWDAYSSVFFSQWNEFSLFASGKISVDFHDLVLFSDMLYINKKGIVNGKCCYKINENTLLPDKVNYEIKLMGELIYSESKNCGLLIQDDDIKINAYLIEQNILELSWQVNKNNFTRKAQWGLSTAIRDALSICTGQTVNFLRRDFYRQNKTVVELIKERDTRDLGFLNPLKQDTILDKDLFLRILEALIKDDKNAKIIRHLFFQIADAMQVSNLSLWEFMVSTSLETALRTYFNIPFQKNKKNDRFKSVEPFLKKWKSEYFNDEYNKEWRKVFNNVNRYYKELRHINTHPDLINSPEFLPIDERQERYNSLIYLCKFYGYIILALVGYKNLKPEF